MVRNQLPAQLVKVESDESLYTVRSCSARDGFREFVRGLKLNITIVCCRQLTTEILSNYQRLCGDVKIKGRARNAHIKKKKKDK